MTATIKPGDTVEVSRLRGVACTVVDYDVEEVEYQWCEHLGDTPDDPDDDDWVWFTDIVERPTGQLVVVMVGDDRRHIVDPGDCRLIDDDDYCPSCGQVGCGWH